MSYKAQSLAVGSALWAKTGTETVREREGTSLQLSSRKRDYDDYSIIFLLYRSTVSCNPGCDLGKPRKLSGFCCCREKAKYNSAVSPFHCKQTSSAFFCKPFRTLSSIHYNTRSIFILREASTRGALEVPWWRTPNRAIRACGVLWKTQVPHQQVPSFTYLGNSHNSQFLPSQQRAHIDMCQPGYCVTSQTHTFSSPRTDKEKQ